MTVRSPLITADPTPSAGQGHKRTRRPRHPYAPKPHDLGATADEMLAVLVKAFPDRALRGSIGERYRQSQGTVPPWL